MDQGWGPLIKEFRKTRRMTQAVFAEFFGVDRTTVNRWEVWDVGTGARLSGPFAQSDHHPPGPHAPWHRELDG